uniref:Sushi domain-containing protein n=1 Tax=Chromera velia CCMP2878 TaxID=1169474 RepID=A0A0G4GX80_9ALVE|eukprot:Cvel_23756.t1-p1 / transcript=Cvel_23756.t1 / gene=Cvel_23756 / organism=Chromera_velia_CCMP2878 / gene_product=hypothetical protein / transcript_product=hypothetical protein / location=Cvel_scaffold2489:5045-5816(-) / protein_length=225 / sequence_SO=supercontig / SO=protein_coding / is_pseudo=false
MNSFHLTSFVLVLAFCCCGKANDEVLSSQRFGGGEMRAAAACSESVPIPSTPPSEELHPSPCEGRRELAPGDSPLPWGGSNATRNETVTITCPDGFRLKCEEGNGRVCVCVSLQDYNNSSPHREGEGEGEEGEQSPPVSGDSAGRQEGFVEITRHCSFTTGGECPGAATASPPRPLPAAVMSSSWVPADPSPLQEVHMTGETGAGGGLLWDEESGSGSGIGLEHS